MRPDLAFAAAAGLAVLLTSMTLLWLVSLRERDASIADPFWGPGFVLVATTYLLADGRVVARGALTMVLIVAWAARLAWHLWVRNRREGEDRRYRAMREASGDRFPWVSLFTVFWLQALLLWIVSAPLLGAIRSSASLGAWDAAGTVLFLTGLTLETVADSQLARFRADPENEGRVLDSGLWRYSRHPNYFGDAVVWWGLYLVSIGGGAYWTFIGPALMTFLLLRVSGVPLLEEGLRRSRTGYTEYVERTSPFWPRPPRR